MTSVPIDRSSVVECGRCLLSPHEQQYKHNIITFLSIFHGATKTKTTTNFQPSKTFSVAQMIFIFSLVFLLPLKPHPQHFVVSAALVGQEPAVPSNNVQAQTAGSSSALTSGGGSGCQPYSKRVELHSNLQECASEQSIENATRVLIERPSAQHDCETCALTVTAHEASHYLALELNTGMSKSTFTDMRSVKKFQNEICEKFRNEMTDTFISVPSFQIFLAVRKRFYFFQKYYSCF